MSTLVGGWVSSSICQYGVKSEGTKGLSILVLHTFYKQKVLVAL